MICLTANLHASELSDFISMVANDPTYSDSKLSSSDIEQYKKAVLDIFNEAYHDSLLPGPIINEDELAKNDSETSSEGSDSDVNVKNYLGFTPNDLYEDYYEIVSSLYSQGYVRKEHLDTWVSKYKTLFAKVVPHGIDVKEFWKNEYVSLFDWFFDSVKANPPVCATVGANATAAKCCQGLVSLPGSLVSSSSNSCLRGSETCQKNDDCCSGVCNQKTPDTPGTCLQKMKCYEVKELGAVCSGGNSVCREGECISYNKNITGLLECKGADSVCSNHDECCSANCISNRCKPKYTCMKCKKNSGTLEAGEQCCPGYINIKNKCYPPLPPFVPSVEIKKKSLWKTIVSIFIPVAYAANDDGKVSDYQVSDEDRKNLSDTQKELIEEKRKACGTDAECIENVNRLEIGYIRDRYTGLTEGQMDEIAEARNECTKNFITSLPCTGSDNNCVDGQRENPDHASCMSRVDGIEKNYLKNNYENGISGKSLAKDDYHDKYHIPGVTAKTYSDIKQCEFNSFNDSWRDASARERNAEIFLRAFEFVYSHKGAQDYWEDAGKGNIFTRANKVAVKFRENRKRMIENMMAIDKEMSCKCLAIFGPSKFNSEKQKYFNESCQEYAAELRQSLGSELQSVNKNLDGNKSSIDGTSISGANDKNKTKIDSAEAEEIDKGAIGISHGKLLVEFLKLRADAQMLRFTDNSELEQELEELSDYIENEDFYEVYFDKIQGKQIVRSSPPGNSYELYGWGYTVNTSLVIILVVVVCIVAGGIVGAIYSGLLSAGLGAAIGAAFGGVFGSIAAVIIKVFSTKSPGGLVASAALMAGMTAAWQYHESDDINAKPIIKDIKIGDKKYRHGLKKAVAYKRFFLGPRFDNQASDQKNRCHVMGRASACFRSAYVIDFSEANRYGKEVVQSSSVKEQNSEYQSYLLDPTLPLFVPETVISMKGMPNDGRPWPDLVNEASIEGIEYLKSRKPGGCLRKWGCDYGKDKKHGNKDILGDAFELGYFFPNRGKYAIEVFGERKNTIMGAAEKYAMCKNLNDCGAKDLEGGELGFGHLFESKLEAKRFAEYAYDIHYKWARLTKESYMGYPATGLGQYFLMASYNMKLAGSLAASRAIQGNEAAEAYYADWKQRVSEYSSLGEASLGTLSKNIKFSPGFYKTFGKVLVTTKTGMASVKAEVADAIKTGNLSKAEIDALNAGVSNAIRRNKAIEKKENFDKALLNASDATKKLVKDNQNALMSKVNAPLERFSVAKLGGGGNGFKKLNNVISNLNDSIKDFNKKHPSKDSKSYGVGSVFTLPKGSSIGSIPSYNSSYGGGGNSSSAVSGPTLNTDTGLNSKQVDSLIDSLSKEDLESHEGDTLFKVVSKAYKRNYSRVLHRNETVKHKNTEDKRGQKREKLDTSEKEQLKKLLTN